MDANYFLGGAKITLNLEFEGALYIIYLELWIYVPSEFKGVGVYKNNAKYPNHNVAD